MLVAKKRGGKLSLQKILGWTIQEKIYISSLDILAKSKNSVLGTCHPQKFKLGGLAMPPRAQTKFLCSHCNQSCSERTLKQHLKDFWHYGLAQWTSTTHGAPLAPRPGQQPHFEILSSVEIKTLGTRSDPEGWDHFFSDRNVTPRAWVPLPAAGVYHQASPPYCLTPMSDCSKCRRLCTRHTAPKDNARLD
jgi:hypothetical protein